jgi:signal transduction histidine kinase
MRAQAQRMNAIIADLLELSRLESTDGEAPRDPIDVPQMLERLHRDALGEPDRPRQVLLELESAMACTAPRTRSSPRSPICW